MKMNKIKQIVINRIEKLERDLILAMEVEHHATTGTLRESYLCDFMAEFMPADVEITSGFITDKNGKISPQLDMIFTYKNSLPPVLMKKGLSIVPIESVLFFGEIKSTLSNDSLDQIKKQNESITKMKLNYAGAQVVPSFILSLRSDLSEKTIKQWMEQRPNNTILCCVLDKFCMPVTATGIQVFRKNEGPANDHIFKCLEILQEAILRQKNGRMNYIPWGSYLQ